MHLIRLLKKLVKPININDNNKKNYFLVKQKRYYNLRKNVYYFNIIIKIKANL
jgi:hypothetical protein